MESDGKNTKLLINLREGIVQVEGDEAFVRGVYDDFKERVSKPVLVEYPPAAQLEHQKQDDEAPGASMQRLNPRPRRKGGATPTTKGEVANYKPAFNPALDLSDLPAFYDQYEPAKHPEKILIFATYLRDMAKVQAITANDIFTCYQELRKVTETPKAFVQALRDAQNKTHFIDYISPIDIQLTIAGNNYFNLKLKKKAAQKVE